MWIAADAESHMQATGRDARGRKQYRYHPQFTEPGRLTSSPTCSASAWRSATLRAPRPRDLAADDLGHDQIVATVVRLLDVTSLRVGNAEYATANRSFGLTTLRNGHASVRGSAIRFTFRGKSAHEFDVSVENPRLAKIVRRCQHLPGQPLFEYRRRPASASRRLERRERLPR